MRLMARQIWPNRNMLSAVTSRRASLVSFSKPAACKPSSNKNSCVRMPNDDCNLSFWQTRGQWSHLIPDGVAKLRHLHPPGLACSQSEPCEQAEQLVHSTAGVRFLGE